MQGQNETQQKNIAVLFDLMRMSSELNKAYEKLRQMQSPNGGFEWFKSSEMTDLLRNILLQVIGALKNSTLLAVCRITSQSPAAKCNAIPDLKIRRTNMKI